MAAPRLSPDSPALDTRASMSRLPSWARLSASDIAWLAGQAVLFIVAFVLLPTADGGPGRLQVPWSRPVGTVVFGVGVVVGLIAMIRLGRQLVAQPTPIQDGRLVTSGLYGVVRHPIYTAVLLLITGSLLRTPSWSGLAVIAISWVFFDRKSAHEERLLARTYPDYAEYQRQVPSKLIPGIR